MGLILGCERHAFKLVPSASKMMYSQLYFFFLFSSYLGFVVITTFFDVFTVLMPFMPLVKIFLIF